MSDLLARLEAASGGDRELDRAVARFAGWHRVEPRFTRTKHGGWIAPEDWIGESSDGRPLLDSLHGTTIYREPPAYTTSVDAALALIERVLPAAPILMGLRQSEETIPWARVGPAWKESDATGATLAIALCIALLKALEASAPQTNRNGE